MQLDDMGQMHCLSRRSYNGLPVGPTLRVKPGDTLRITVNNQLGTHVPDPPYKI
jgi:hypothetical protein